MQLLSAELALKRAPLALSLMVALAVAVGGCAASERLTAGRHDYALYREFRLADNGLERLRHGNRYLKEVPDGRFRPEVAAWFRQQEPAFYRMARDRPSLLRAYLAALPDGPHAEEVIDRLIELQMLRQYRDEEARRRDKKLNRALVEVADAERARSAALGKLATSIRAVAGFRGFGKPAQEAARELSTALELPAPGLACGGSRCTGQLSLRYAIPGERRLVMRAVDIVVELGVEGGKAQAVALSGRELWSRLAELLSLGAVTSADFGARVDAIAKSVAFVGNVTAPHFPSARCERAVVAPVVLARECDDVSLQAFAGTEPTETDGLRVLRLEQGRRPKP